MSGRDVFIDSDVLLDVALKRQPHYEDAQKILALIESNRIGGHTSALIVANCYDIISSLKDKVVADKAIKKIRSILHVLPLTDRELGESLHSNFSDFEDGVQYFVALNNGIETIITRNVGDYKKASMTVLAPMEFLRLEPVAAMFGKAT